MCPMVIIPWFTDSVANAARCAQAGVARIVPRDKITPDAVRAACADVLARPTYGRGGRGNHAAQDPRPAVSRRPRHGHRGGRGELARR